MDRLAVTYSYQELLSLPKMHPDQHLYDGPEAAGMSVATGFGSIRSVNQYRRNRRPKCSLGSLERCSFAH